MKRIRRGEVFWIDPGPIVGDERAGRLPWLVVSHDVFNDRSGTAMALAVTSAEPRAGFPLTWRLESGRLPKRSWVKISQIRTLSVERVGRRLARASGEELAGVIDGLNEIVG